MCLFFPFVCSSWRRRGLQGAKQKGGVISLGSLPIEERNSLAYTRDEPHDTVHHGIRSSPRPEHNNFMQAQPDLVSWMRKTNIQK